MTERGAGADSAVRGHRDAFRPIQYLGSKARVLTQIEQEVDGVAAPHATVLDLFSGSATVSCWLASRRRVYAVDVQEYARVLAAAATSASPPAPGLAEELVGKAAATYAVRARGSWARALSLESEARALAEQGDLVPLVGLLEEGSPIAHALGRRATSVEVAAALESAARCRRSCGEVVARYYGSVYFGYSQALELDALLAEVRRLREPERAAALASVLGAASDVVASVGGHFAQPIRPRRKDGAIKGRAVRAVGKRWGTSVFDAFRRRFAAYAQGFGAVDGCRAFRADFRELLPRMLATETIGAVYADPPYTRDHYSRFYHVLETIALGDRPDVTLAPGGVSGPTRGLYRTGRHQSPFSIATEVGPAFDFLFHTVAQAGVPLVLSYSPLSQGTEARPQTRLMAIEDLVNVAGRAFAQVDVCSPGAVKHSRLNQASVSAPAALEGEVLLTCRP